VKERPIIFTGRMVRAILGGAKTATRRPCKPAIDPLRGRGPAMSEPAAAVYPDGSGEGWIAWWGQGPFSAEETARIYPGNAGFRCPYGVPGDRLWIRETWAPGPKGPIFYTDSRWDDGYPREAAYELGVTGWRSPLFLRRADSRIDLEVVDVRVERLHDITEEDAAAEGCHPEFEVDLASFVRGRTMPESTHVLGFKHAWSRLHGRESWDANPWVWRVGFKVIRPMLGGA
jgi:hypothetical protein